MAEKLQVTDDVGNLAQNLRSIRAAFEGADRTADTLADAVGHPRLAGVLRDFAGQWDDRRRELAQQVDRVAELAAAVDQGFADADRELARATDKRDAPTRTVA
jgi:uncharacterized protein YukE